MKSKVAVCVAVVAGLLAVCGPTVGGHGNSASARMLGQTRAQSGADSQAAASFDPHDLSGVWGLANGVPGQGIHDTPSATPPPMTPWGQAKFDANKPGYGPRAAPGGNDPILTCDPSGVPKILFTISLFEIVQNADRTFMFFERDHSWRQIWTDGRKHDPGAADTYMGDSIGWWEGDTFVVDSTGFNEKSWIDAFGYPHSDEMHMVERFKRDHETLTLQLSIDDPKTYTKTWLSDTKIYRRMHVPTIAELFCIPEEEAAFNKRIRAPAAAASGKSIQ